MQKTYHRLLELGLPLPERPASYDDMSFTCHGSSIREYGVDPDFWCGTVSKVRVEILDDGGLGAAGLRSSQSHERK